ncbi:MAG: isoaspartyl peptidase/L-asparaginase, partial [Cyclobacteriaceae bacterium]
MNPKHYNRRHFIKVGALGVSSATLSVSSASALSGASTTPIIISTWDHGAMANNVGYKLLAKGADAIDAVQQGVMVVESDPKVRTVGVGGYPDRDGVVTLDACLMKGDGSCGSVAFLRDIENPVAVARKVMDQTP